MGSVSSAAAVVNPLSLQLAGGDAGPEADQGALLVDPQLGGQTNAVWQSWIGDVGFQLAQSLPMHRQLRLREGDRVGAEEELQRRQVAALVGALGWLAAPPLERLAALRGQLVEAAVTTALLSAFGQEAAFGQPRALA